MINDETAGLTPEQEEIRSKFLETRGYWNPFWNGLLQLDPEYLRLYLELSAHPWKKGTLEPKVREFVYIAIDASTTHLYEPGLRQHFQNAFKYGATKEEIVEVLELTAGLGIHSCTMGMPILIEEAARFENGSLE